MESFLAKFGSWAEESSQLEGMLRKQVEGMPTGWGRKRGPA